MAKKMSEENRVKTEDVQTGAEDMAADGTAAPTENPRTADKPEAAREAVSGFYCYIGPNLKGLIQTGTIFRGTRAQAEGKAAAAIAAHPEVRGLIVPGEKLDSLRLKVKTPGNALYNSFKTLERK